MLILFSYWKGYTCIYHMTYFCIKYSFQKIYSEYVCYRKVFIYYKVCLGNWLIYKLIHLYIIFWETYQFWWCMLIVFIMFVYLQTERTISRVNLCYMTSYAIARSKVSGYYWWNMYVYTKAWEWTCKNFW